MSEENAPIHATFNHDVAPPCSTHDRARALHRVIRAMHDGHCPNCAYLGPAENFQVLRSGLSPGRSELTGHRCPECGFSITTEEEVEALKEFAPFFQRCVAVLEAWRAERAATQPQGVFGG